MQLLAIAMARWVLPVPMPPTSTALRCWVMKSPPARSRTSVSLIGVSSNRKSSRSLASGIPGSRLRSLRDRLLDGSADPDDEVIPEVPASPRTRLGDIWILGEHRVGCGDARDLDFVRRLVGEQAAIDAAFLDPPYNVRISGHANAVGRHREFAMASAEMDEAEFRAFLKQTLEVCASVSRHGAVHFVCMDWRHMDDVSAVGKAVYGDLLNVCVWNKSNAGMGSLYRSKHELIFVFRVGDKPHFNAVQLGKHGRNRTNVWDYASVNSFKGSRREDLALHP